MRYIEHLRLTDFRSYDQLDLSLSGAPVVLFGANGAGKTNLLEAVSFLSPGRGIRRAKVEDIARRTNGDICPAWGITANLGGLDLPMKLAVGQVPEYPKRRTVRIDDKSATGATLAGHMTMMWLTPAQDRLFVGPSSDRRKFLDRFTLAHTPTHGFTSLRYEKLRTERNRLLSDGIDDRGWYDAIETDMADHGAKIARARAETVNTLIAELTDQPDSAFPQASLLLDGEAEQHAQNGWGVDEISEFIRRELADNRTQDMRAGRTLMGIHKTEFKVTHLEKNMPAADCSTGEQKALLISLVLAHARAQIARTPILLLDEVAAHLDVHRRAALSEHLIALGTQVFMTGTDQSLFEAFGDRADKYEVTESRLKPISRL